MADIFVLNKKSFLVPTIPDKFIDLDDAQKTIKQLQQCIGDITQSVMVREIMTLLVKGAANTKLFMNTAATAPEWATGIKFTTITRDMTAATGNVAITGVGFKPSAVISFYGINGTMSVGWGLQVGTALGYMGYIPGSAMYGIAGSAYFGVIYGSASNYQLFNVGTWESDGVTLAFTKGGSPTGTAIINMIFLR